MSVGLANILQSSEGVWSKGTLRPACYGGVGGVTTFTAAGSISRKWGPGELEFEALMRMLDNKVVERYPNNYGLMITMETLYISTAHYQVQSSSKVY